MGLTCNDARTRVVLLVDVARCLARCLAPPATAIIVLRIFILKTAIIKTTGPVSLGGSAAGGAISVAGR